MITKCKYCSSPIPADTTVCPVCKIDCAKDKTQLTPQEIQVWHAARNLRIASFFAILIGVFTIFLFLILMAPGAMPVPLSVVLVNLVLGATAIWIGASIKKYKQWTYGAGIALFVILLLLHFSARRWFGVFIAVALLYCIANPAAKKILYREV